MKHLQVKTNDAINVKDKMFTYRLWIGKLKGFFTVKINPKRLD